MEKSPGKSTVAKIGKLVIMMDEAELEQMKDAAKVMASGMLGIM